ncbi:MAG TPA: O-antigen ligase family protein [Coriobacteriia bacterium]|nr:O-antigen ligase family protein [Coriobacteriia bacterium]
MSKRTKKNRRPAVAVATEMSMPQRIAWYALHAMVFAVPVAIANWTWLPGIEMPFSFDQFDIVKVAVLRALTLVALAAWACHMLVFGGAVRRTKVDYLILAMLGWLALSTVLSIHPETALFGKYRRFEGLISFVNYAVVYFLAVQYLDRLSRVRSLARTLFFSGVVVGGYGVLQYLGADPLNWAELPFEANRAFSTFGNPNMLGGFLVIVLPIALSLALSEPDRRWRALYWSGVMLTALCWVVAFTRGAWIGGAVALIALGIAAWRMRVRPTRVDWSFAGAAAALAAVAVGRSLATDDPVMNAWNRLVSILEFGEGSAVTRFQIWDAAWRATLDRPIFGFGLDTFRLIFPGYKPIEYTAAAGHQSVADNAHNYVLQLTSGVGIPGMLLVYGVFAAVAVLSIRTVFATADRSRGASGALLLSGMWAAVIGYLVHLTFGISVTGSTFLAWILFAALMSPGARAVELRPPAWGKIAAGAVVLAIAVASVGNATYLLADRHHLLSYIGAGHAQRLAHAEEAARLNPLNDMYRTRVGLIEVEAFLSFLQQVRMQEQAGADTTATRAQAESAFRIAETSLIDTIEFVPHEYDNYMFIANVYNIAGQALSPDYFEEAKRWARKGIEVSEFGPGIRFQYAVALDATGQTEEAVEELLFAIEMDPAYADPRKILGEIYLRDGDPAAALEQFEQIRVLNPQFPGIDEMIATAAGATGTAGE